MSRKFVFFGLPASSVHNTLVKIIDRIGDKDNLVVYFNTVAFSYTGKANVVFKAYPDYKKGYNTDEINEQTSYFQFAESLLNTSLSIMDDLVSEVEAQKPDCILYSHLAMWGRIVAAYSRLPSVALFTTFVLDRRIMIPVIRSLNTTGRVNFQSIDDGIRFHRKFQALVNKLGIRFKYDLWDAYVNTGDLNLVYVLPELQPRRELFQNGFYFLGYPEKKYTQAKSARLIYVSMGTVFNKNSDLFNSCIVALSTAEYDVVISVGRKIKSTWPISQLPDHIKVEPYVDQVATLRNSVLFISRGGMASVHEAICTGTPMIIIPEIPEQFVTAKTLDSLGAAIYLDPSTLSSKRIQEAVERILENRAEFVYRLNSLRHSGFEGDVAGESVRLIESHLDFASPAAE